MSRSNWSLVSVVAPLAAVLLTAPLAAQRWDDPAPKDPGLAALFSLLITGAGQAYNEEYLKGGLLLAASVPLTLWAADNISSCADIGYADEPRAEEWCRLGWIELGAVLAIKVYSIVDAGAGAKRFNRRGGGIKVGLVPLGGAESPGAIGLSVVQIQF